MLLFLHFSLLDPDPCLRLSIYPFIRNYSVHVYCLPGAGWPEEWSRLLTSLANLTSSLAESFLIGTDTKLALLIILFILFLADMFVCKAPVCFSFLWQTI